MHSRVRRSAVFVNENVIGCHGEKWVKHYSSDHRILLVGEGDFSFSLSLAVSFGSGSNIVATSFDTLGALIKKYKKVESNLETLKNLGASVLHGVDATQMQCHESLRMYKFDRIVFNFPHAGFHGKEANPRMIEMHRNLLRGFFSNAILMLKTDGEVHVTHKTAPPYCLWNIEELAWSNSLNLIDSVGFLINDYPGYSNKRGHGANSDDPFPLGECRTFKFMKSRGSRPHIYSDFDCKTYQLLEYKRDNMINYHNYGQLTPTVYARRETEGVSNVYKHAVLKYGSEVNNPGGPIKQMQMENWERLVQARSFQQLKGDHVLLQRENAPFNSRHPEQVCNIDRDKFLGYVSTPRIINFRSEDSIEPGSCFNHASKTRDRSFNFCLDEPLRCHRSNYMGKAWDRTLNGYPSMSPSSMHYMLEYVHHIQQASEWQGGANTSNRPRTEQLIGWCKPPPKWVKLNTNGACIRSSSCGGLLRDSSGAWLGGFVHNIGRCSPVSAELLGVLSGLKLAWHLGYRWIVLEVDSIAVINILTSPSTRPMSLDPLVLDINEFFSRKWIILPRHVHKEGNRCADWLAKFATQFELGSTILENAPTGCLSFLSEDTSGICFSRLVL